MSKYAFIFPGQGSQSVGMLASLIAEYPEMLNTFTEASDVLGYNMHTLVSEGPDTQLNQTEFTQPALLACSVAMWRVLQSRSPSPAFFAGHSLGEYSALTCAGVLEFSDALSLVRDRGRYMQSAVAGDGYAMAAILALDDQTVKDICAQVSTDDAYVAAVNFNTPGQVVVAGNDTAVQAVIEQCKAAGAKSPRLLPVSVPSHCKLMHPAAEQLDARMADITFNTPQYPVLNNADLKMEEEPDAIKAALIKQLYSPVKWGDTIAQLIQMGVQKFYECGPDAKLARMGKRIDKSATFQAFSDSKIFAEFQKELA